MSPGQQQQESSQLLQIVQDCIKSYQDFPKKGILFRDVLPVLRDSEGFQALISLLRASVQHNVPNVDVIVGLESRGFLLAPILALHFKVPFVPIRKAGKLPGLTKQVTYNLEYGNDTFEAQVDSIPSNSTVVIVDDLLATGGSLAASCQLVKSMGSTVALCLVVIELAELEGAKKLEVPLKSLLKY